MHGRLKYSLVMYNDTLSSFQKIICKARITENVIFDSVIEIVSYQYNNSSYKNVLFHYQYKSVKG